MGIGRTWASGFWRVGGGGHVIYWDWEGGSVQGGTYCERGRSRGGFWHAWDMDLWL